MQSAQGLETRILTAGEAHNEAMSLPIPTVVESLVGLLGATTVAEIAGVKETRAVQQWASGEREPQRSHVLRFALQLAMMISTVTSRHMAGAWFHGANPHLDDQIPIVLLRDQPLESIQVRLMAAVRSFASRNE
ncbi:MAG: hypothetical protein WA304_00995 [Candidatus Cybelea sp.]